MVLGNTSYIRSYQADVFASPVEKSTRITMAKRGEKVQELDKAGNWTKIRINNNEGWILRMNLSPVVYPSKIKFEKLPIVKKTKKRRNLRLRVARAAVGVKGLRKPQMDNLKEKETDFKALEKMERFKIDEQTATKFITSLAEQ